MPNGRSGGFPIERADLKELARTIADETTAKEVIHFFEVCPHRRVAVEEW